MKTKEQIAEPKQQEALETLSVHLFIDNALIDYIKEKSSGKFFQCKAKAVNSRGEERGVDVFVHLDYDEEGAKNVGVELNECYCPPPRPTPLLLSLSRGVLGHRGLVSWRSLRKRYELEARGLGGVVGDCFR